MTKTIRSRCFGAAFLGLILVVGCQGSVQEIATSDTSMVTGSRMVGMYVGSPGFISSCMPFPHDLPTNPHFNGGQPYTTDTAAYMNYMLDDNASMGVDFLVLDESNGIHYGCPPLQATLQQLLDIADGRMRAGIRTPHITIMSPMPGTAGGAGNDNDWIFENLVISPATGQPRPSWFWLGGKPVWGVYTANPFRTDYSDNRFHMKYVCNGANNECHQAQVDLGNVWPWSTMGQSEPLSSSHSNEITIQNGYQNIVPCRDYWHTCAGFKVGYTSAYYADQWNFATARNPAIILITAYDNVEGGWIQSRSDFSPASQYVDQTRAHVNGWKGSLSLGQLGPPPPPPAVQPPTACGALLAGQGLHPGQAVTSCNGSYTLIMQGDGNLVLYQGGTPLWQTATEGVTGAGGEEVVMQPDGNLVVYSSTGRAVWSAGTYGYAGARLAIQGDSNLVIYSGSRAIWRR